ncbi:MAG: hypothetical protein JHC93_01895, partial [Parachlamydiales bacterium]|nr:hypothetical protein [Parachlamydiales bacterium]
MISPTVHSLTTHASPPPNIIVKGNKQHVADSNYTSTIQSLKKINQKSAHSVKENLFEKIQGLINQCVISIRYLYKTFRNFLRPPTIPVPKPTMINPNINSPTPIHRGIEPLAHLVTNHSIQQLISQIDKIFNSSKALILELQTHLNAHVVKFESSIKFEGQPFVKALGDNISEKYDHFIVEYQNLSRTVSNCQSQIKDILFKYYTEKNYNYIPPLKEEQIKDLQLQLDLVKETISNFLEKSLLELKWVEEKKCELLKKSIENLE